MACLVALIASAFAGPVPTGYGPPHVSGFEFSHDGKVFIAHGSQSSLSGRGGTLGWLMVFDAATGKELARLSGDAFSTSAHHVPLRPGTDEVVLAQPCAEDKAEQIVLRSWRKPKEVRRLPASRGHAHFAYFAFSPDGKRCVSGHWDNRLLLWDLAAGKLERALDRPRTDRTSSDQAARCYFLPGGKEVLATFNGAPSALYNLQTGKEVPTKLPRDVGHVYAVSPDGKRVVTSEGYLGKYRDRKPPPLRLWDLKTGEKVAEFSVPDGEFYHVCDLTFSNDGKSLIVLARGGLHVWPIEGGARPRKPVELLGYPSDARFSPDGARLVGAAPWGHAAAWDVRTGKLRWQEEIKPLVEPASDHPRPSPRVR